MSTITTSLSRRLCCRASHIRSTVALHQRTYHRAEINHSRTPICTINRTLHTTIFKRSTDPEPPADFTPRGDSVDEAVRSLADMFGECRMDIEDARESIGTTYYSDDAENAQQSVGSVLRQWQHSQSLAEKEGGDVVKRLRQGWALKLEQLKGELEQMLHEAGD